MKRKKLIIKKCTYCPFRGGIGGSSCNLRIDDEDDDQRDCYSINGCLLFDESTYECKDFPSSCPLLEIDGITIFALETHSKG